jgi:hypothetical protein
MLNLFLSSFPVPPKLEDNQEKKQKQRVKETKRLNRKKKITNEVTELKQEQEQKTLLLGGIFLPRTVSLSRLTSAPLADET